MASNRRHGVWMSQKDFGNLGKMAMKAEPGVQSIASRVKIIPGIVDIIEVDSVGNIIEGTRNLNNNQEQIFKILATNIGTHMQIKIPGNNNEPKVTPLQWGTKYLSELNGHGLIFKSNKGRGNSSLYIISIDNNKNIHIEGGRTRRTRRARKTRHSRKH